MSLIHAFLQPCVILNRTKEADGEGGYKIAWKEGAQIDVAIVQDTSLSARVAESDGVTSTYTLTTFDVPLEYHDVIKRLSDGLILRVTNDMKSAPSVSTMKGMMQVNAEKWKLTE